MPTLDPTLTLTRTADLTKEAPQKKQSELQIALLTGCQDKSYACELALALSSHGVRIDIIGNDQVDFPQYHTTPNLHFLNFGGIQQKAGFSRKFFQLLAYYARLLRYIATAKPKLLHILWNSKFEHFDRTILMLYGKLCGKNLVFTAHNTNKAKRDSEDSPFNRLTLTMQYRLVDHIFVHTEKMKSELLNEFGVRDRAVTIIPYGLYNSLPNTDLTPAEAKRQLGIRSDEKTILFFGRIVPYKGLEYVLSALQTLLPGDPNYRLIIAGEPMQGYEKYMNDINELMDRADTRAHITDRLHFIPDEQTELYFKAADALILPYKEIFQSGVLFMGYTFGLPILAADVGSFRQDIVEGKTGFVFKPCDTADLSRTIEKYFQSDLYKSLDQNRQAIRDFANEGHSSDVVGAMTRNVYQALLKRTRADAQP